MPIGLEVEGLEELRLRFQGFPSAYYKAMSKTMVASLLVLWENVPSYPPAIPGGWYVRTGLLGRSLGSGMEGGKHGPPDILEVKYGSRFSEGTFGSRVYYAPDVIGENQDPFFAGRGWWNIMTIVNKAKGKIETLWKAMADELAKYLDGRSL